MALAGHDEIVVAVEPDLAGLAGDARAQRRDGRPLAGLTLLAAEAAAHAARLDDHEGVGHAEHAGHDMLRLGRVLGRDIHVHLDAFARHRERGLALEIEMLLPADAELPFEAVRRGAQRALDVAASEFVVGQHAPAGRQRVLDGDRGLCGGDVDPGQSRGAARGVAGLRDHREQRLTVKQDLLLREQRLVVEGGGDVVAAGDVGRGQHRYDIGRRAHGAEVERAQFARRLVRHADANVQRARGLADVVEIGRGAAHMRARAVMRMRLVHHRRLALQRHDGNLDFPIRRHGALPVASGRRRPKFPSERASRDWRRPPSDRRSSPACR